MTDFSFQNKAYDLLLNLKEDGIIEPKIKSVKEVRLLMDIIETANQTKKEYYRPVECWEIIPGIKLKIVEPSGTWYHTFWTYTDTGHVIPPDETTLEAYSNAYMYIWEKAKKGNVFIEQTFKFKINDYVTCKSDQSLKGYIFDKCMLIGVKRHTKYTNAYRIEWETPPKDIYWFDEDDLIKKLEVLPMKTNKRKKVEYKEYNPKEWIKQEVAKGLDEATCLSLLNPDWHGPNHENDKFGWIIKTKKANFRRNPDAKNAIQRKNERRRRKEKRIYPFKSNTKKIKEQLKRVKDISTGEINSIPRSMADILTNRESGLYIYVTKTEWREYLKSKKAQPKLCLPEGKDKMGKEYGNGNTRRVRRADIKRPNFRRFHLPPKQSKEDLEERRLLDYERYLRKKGKKSLDELKTIFSADERRNEHFSLTEKWSRSFVAIYRAVTTSITEVAKGIFVSLPKKGVKVAVNTILKYQHKLTWSEEKINDFIRYLRLTTHDVFTGPKPVKPKKVKQIIEHEPIKFVTRIDHSKLRYDDDKKLVADEDAITQVPIKYRRKRNGKSNNTVT